MAAVEEEVVGDSREKGSPGLTSLPPTTGGLTMEVLLFESEKDIEEDVPALR